MKMKFVVSAIAACTLMSGAALAEQDRNKHKHRSSAASVAAGVAAAGPQGAVAGGGAASEARQERRGNRRASMANRRATERCVPGTASTSTSGAVYTDRTRASAAGTTSGTASGSGTNRTSSDIDASAYTDRQGSDAYVTGGSTAVAREPTRRC